MVTEPELIAIYRQTVHPLYAYVSCRTGGQRELAEDIVQETYIRAWEHWRRKPADTPLAWLKTVARNLLVSHYRRIQPRSLEDLGFDPAADTPDLSQPGTVALLQWGLARIKRSRALLLESFYFDEQQIQKIADEHKISVRAVEGRLRRARQDLRKKLERSGYVRGGC